MIDFDRLLHLAAVTPRMRLRLRRHFLNCRVDRERRRIIKSGGSAEDVWSDGSWQFEYQLLEEDETSFHSRQLLERARKLRIPAPPMFIGSALSSDYQRSGLDSHVYYLSIDGEQKVRSAIREEEKYRAERWARRIPYITALSGLIGTITGLVALLDKLGS